MLCSYYTKMAEKKKKIQLLGVDIEPLTRKEVCSRIVELLDSTSFSLVVTPNAEILLVAQKDQSYRAILNSAALQLTDSISLSYASLFLSWQWLQRTCGTDILEFLIEQAMNRKKSILFLLPTVTLLSELELCQFLLHHYQKLEYRIVFAQKDSCTPKIVSDLHQGFTPQVIICVFGAPFQEVFLYEAEKSGLYPKVSLAIGVGGALDYVKGKRSRGPKWVQQLGFEWLWRFLQEPRYRFWRIINAVIVFPVRILLSKFMTAEK